MSIKAGNLILRGQQSIETADVPTLADILKTAENNVVGYTKDKRPANSILNKLKKQDVLLGNIPPTSTTDINQPSMKDAFYKTSKYLQDLTQK